MKKTFKWNDYNTLYKTSHKLKESAKLRAYVPHLSLVRALHVYVPYPSLTRACVPLLSSIIALRVFFLSYVVVSIVRCGLRLKNPRKATGPNLAI